MKANRSDVHLVNRADVLALLEDGPKDTGVLATWLGQPSPRLIAALNTMARDGLVKRVGAARLWALANYVAPIGRPSKSPWRTPKEPAVIGESHATVITLKKLPVAVESWWTKYATPDTPFEEFRAAAAARDAEMSEKSHAWRSLKAVPTT